MNESKNRYFMLRKLINALINPLVNVLKLCTEKMYTVTEMILIKFRVKRFFMFLNKITLF